MIRIRVTCFVLSQATRMAGLDYTKCFVKYQPDALYIFDSAYSPTLNTAELWSSDFTFPQGPHTTTTATTTIATLTATSHQHNHSLANSQSQSLFITITGEPQTHKRNHQDPACHDH